MNFDAKNQMWCVWKNCVTNESMSKSTMPWITLISQFFVMSTQPGSLTKKSKSWRGNHWRGFPDAFQDIITLMMTLKAKYIDWRHRPWRSGWGWPGSFKTRTGRTWWSGWSQRRIGSSNQVITSFGTWLRRFQDYRTFRSKGWGRD